MKFAQSQYDQIAAAILLFPDTDMKANLVQILACNFIVSDRSFDQFPFIQHCYVKHADRHNQKH